jgi:hypothetical protein
MSDTPLDRWRSGATVRPLAVVPDAHVLHSYFTCCPESPDGTRVLAFVSRRADAGVGEICVVERAGGRIEVLAADVEVEDAHRQANQHWTCGGAYVVYMAFEAGNWRVMRVRPDGTDRACLAEGRQVCFGQPLLDVVPLHGAHWDPGSHRGLELLDVRTGAIRTALCVEEVVDRFAPYVREAFPASTRPFSIFFPILSPDGTRVFFKLATACDGRARSSAASDRKGLFVYDLAGNRWLGMRPAWGHPAWFGDSRRILDKSVVVDTDTMETRTIAWYPERLNSHASVSPDARLLAADFGREPMAARDRHWALVVGDYGSSWTRVADAPASGDLTSSWRPAHPHPVFDATGARVYFNVNEGTWARVYVAERAAWPGSP